MRLSIVVVSVLVLLNQPELPYALTAAYKTSTDVYFNKRSSFVSLNSTLTKCVRECMTTELLDCNGGQVQNGNCYMLNTLNALEPPYGRKAKFQSFVLLDKQEMSCEHEFATTAQRRSNWLFSIRSGWTDLDVETDSEEDY